MKKTILSGVLVSMLLLFNSCAKNPVTGHRDLMLMSESQEIAMGQQSDPQIVASLGLYQDPTLQKFVNEKGQQMASISQRKNLKYEFKIVDTPVVNAFAVPGGYIYITRGILAQFNNEAEFAGVIGHEIGHIAARHSAKQYTNSMLGQIGILAGSVLSPTFAQYADVASQGLGLLFLKFGRDAESQADKLGVEYSTKVGYDAKEMASFFDVLDRMSPKGGEVPTFLSTHPDPADRERKVAKLADSWQKKVDASTLEVNRDSYLRMIDGIVYGEDPKQGFVENNMFYHPELRFQFQVPTSWQVQNSPQAVQMGDGQGQAMMMFTLAQGNSLEAAAQNFLKQYGLTTVESQRDNVNGLNAIVVVADQASQQSQQQVRTLTYFIQYGGNIYTMLGATAKANFANYARIFQSVSKSFNELTDQEKLSREAEHVRIKTIGQSTTLQKALASYGMPEKRYEELAVLNGMQINERVPAGTLIKVVERGTPLNARRN
jgi:predicted Zn-dependent protease